MANENEEIRDELPDAEAPPEEQLEEASAEDESLKNEDEEHSDDEQAAFGETDEEAEARRQRNRQMREDRKNRRREKEETYRRELAARDALIMEQNERLASLERRSQGADMAQLDGAMNQATQAYHYFKQMHAQAIEQANGAMATDAAEKMGQAQHRYHQLNSIKQQAVRAQSAPQPLDPRLRDHAEKWMTQHRWYDPRGTDEDSAIALTVDQRLAQEGFDPRMPEYWDELDARLKKFLPHRYKAGYNGAQGQKSRPPVAGSGRESAPSGNKSTYKLSPQRVQALKDLGVWDDPKLREEHIRNFREYDKANGLV